MRSGGGAPRPRALTTRWRPSRCSAVGSRSSAQALDANADPELAESSPNGLVDQLELSDLDPNVDQAAVGAKVQAALTQAIQAC